MFMKALILAGGLGTRLRPLTFAIPKPLIPIKEKPIMEMIIENLREQGIVDIFVATGYKSEIIKLYFQGGSKFNVNITYLDEEKRLGTAGSLGFLKGRINEPLLVMNGDILTDLNFLEMLTFHKTNCADFTLGIRKYIYQLRYGSIETKGIDVKNIREKPEIEFHINGGIYIINPEVLDFVPVNDYYDIPDLIQCLVAKKRKVLAYEIKGRWFSIEEIDDYGNYIKNQC